MKNCSSRSSIVRAGAKTGKLLWAALFVFAAPSVFAQEQGPGGSADRGYQTYMKYQCYTCHGTVGQGGNAGPRIAPNPISWPSFERQMRAPRQDMPAYRKQFLGDQELADMYAYLRSVKPSPAPKEIPLLNFSGRFQQGLLPSQQDVRVSAPARAALFPAARFPGRGPAS